MEQSEHPLGLFGTLFLGSAALQLFFWSNAGTDRGTDLGTFSALSAPSDCSYTLIILLQKVPVRNGHVSAVGQY